MLRWRRTYSSRFVAGGPVRAGLGVVGVVRAGRGRRRRGGVHGPRRPDGGVRPGARRRRPGAGDVRAGRRGIAAPRWCAVETRRRPDRAVGAALGPGSRRGPGRCGPSTPTAWCAGRRPGGHGHVRLHGRAADVAWPTRAAGALTLDWDGARVVGGAVVVRAGGPLPLRRGGATWSAASGWSGDRRYETDADGRIVEVWDADGVRLCRNTYDDEGRVLAQVSPFGREILFAYHPGNRTVVSDTDGRAGQHLRARPGRPARRGWWTTRATACPASFDAEGRCVRGAGLRRHRPAARSSRPTACRATRTGPGGVAERWEYDDRRPGHGAPRRGRPRPGVRVRRRAARSRRASPGPTGGRSTSRPPAGWSPG